MSMKYRIFPKKTLVLQKLQDRLGVLMETLEEARKKDAALAESLLFVANEDRKAAVYALRDALDAVQKQSDIIDLFTSHKPEEVAVEYED